VVEEFRLKARIARYWQSFSFVGLTLATMFFSASVTPSLLPRNHWVQGILSGFSIATGYGIGVAIVGLLQFLEVPAPGRKVQRIAKWLTAGIAAMVFVAFLWRMTFWQNSIRMLMDMPALETAYPYRTAVIAIVFGAILISLGRLFLAACHYLGVKLQRFVPRRIAMAMGFSIVTLSILLLSNDLLAKRLLGSADAIFSEIDESVDDGMDQPSSPLLSGSPSSLVAWESIGRQGKRFLTLGPTKQDIADFSGREAKDPIRVYVGLRSRSTVRERSQLALEELKRAGGFDRDVLIVATPTGTGWLDPSAVDTVEYLHGGDTAIVSTQYSYLPSWITILVDPQRSIVSSQALMDEIYGYWKTLPKDDRPRLYLQGLSLGSLGSEISTDLMTVFEDPIDGAVWSGPPFPSQNWNRAVQNRVAGTPAWLPKFRDSRLLRFTSQQNNLNPELPWGPIRNVYIQYASDPMVWFSSNLAWSRPDWLGAQRGPDVSPHLTWYPIITFLQVGFDLPMATTVPIGYGHNYSPSSYIDAWIAVTSPTEITNSDVEQLKAHFVARESPKP
jgi:uncharacterized membrane protein